MYGIELTPDEIQLVDEIKIEDVIHKILYIKFYGK